MRVACNIALCVLICSVLVCDAVSLDVSCEAASLYVAASLSTAFDAALRGVPPVTTGACEPAPPRLIAGSSSTLARQLARGAPPGIYVSASTVWMADLEERGLLVPDTRRSLFRNRLLLVESMSSQSEESSPAHSNAGDASTQSNLKKLPERNPAELTAVDFRELIRARLATHSTARLCIGDPEHVPLGMYTRQALERSGIWTEIRDRVLPAADARRNIWYLEQHACAIGVVYQTDLSDADHRNLRALGLVPANLHGPIVYEIAMVRGAPPQARALYDFFVFSPTARAVFQSHGFGAFE